jgi:hypothetical protein
MEGATLHLEYELAKCLHSLRMGHALQLGLLLVQKTCSYTQTGIFLKQFPVDSLGGSSRVQISKASSRD